MSAMLTRAQQAQDGKKPESQTLDQAKQSLAIAQQAHMEQAMAEINEVCKKYGIEFFIDQKISIRPLV